LLNPFYNQSMVINTLNIPKNRHGFFAVFPVNLFFYHLKTRLWQTTCKTREAARVNRTRIVPEWDNQETKTPKGRTWVSRVARDLKSGTKGIRGNPVNRKDQDSKAEEVHPNRGEAPTARLTLIRTSPVIRTSVPTGTKGPVKAVHHRGRPIDLPVRIRTRGINVCDCTMNVLKKSSRLYSFEDFFCALLKWGDYG